MKLIRQLFISISYVFNVVIVIALPVSVSIVFIAVAFFISFSPLCYLTIIIIQSFLIIVKRKKLNLIKNN